jgi:hypothetical protein
MNVFANIRMLCDYVQDTFMHVLWIGCRKANSHFGKLTAVISNNWSKSTAVAFVFQKQLEIFFNRRHTTGNCLHFVQEV